MISYQPLRILLDTEKMKMHELTKNKIIIADTAVKFNNDSGFVSLATIDKVMNYLSQKLDRAVTVEEIIRFVPDEVDPAGE